MSKILMVDDDPVMLDMLQEILEEDAGHVVLKTDKPAEALRLFETTQPDLVMMDVMMPGMDGLELLRKLKEIRRDFKSVLLSGMNDEKLKDAAEALGADRYLLKPVKIDSLKKMIEGLLRASA